ncbi:MAG: hypothetical protein Q9162_001133 [Coniocarpon cinnabarinum]
MKHAEQGSTANTGEEQGARRRGKRKRAETTVAEDDDRPARRTRSQRNAAPSQSNTAATDEPMIIESDDNGDADFSPTSTASSPSKSQQQPDDGLVACPVCFQRMKEAAVSAHLDNACPGFSSAQNQHPAQYPTPKPQRAPDKPPERLPQISYSLFNDAKLKKKLAELGIPTFGSRQLLQRRHSEWLALWNANCDAKHPRTRRLLLQDLDAWERSQGGRSAGEPAKNGVMQKDFDGAAWAKKNRNDFGDLIKKARENKKSKPDSRGSASNDQEQDSAQQDQDLLAANGDVASPPTQRALTAPPFTEVNSPPNPKDPSPHSNDKILPSLNKTASLPEPPSPSTTVVAHRSTSNAQHNYPPPPATLMFTNSVSSAESRPSTAATDLPAPAVPFHALPSIDVSPVRSRRDSLVNGDSKLASPTTGDFRSRRSSLMSSSAVPGLERKDTGSGDPGPATKVPMFQVSSRHLVDGDGTGTK